MRKHTQTNDLLPQQRRFSFWSFLIILSLIITIGLSGFVAWKKQSLSLQRENLKSLLLSLDEEIKKQEKKEGFNRQKALEKGRTIFKKAVAYRIPWSKVYHDVSELEKGVAVFYRISADKNLKFNVSGLTNSLDGVSALLVRIKSHPHFKDAFVSQIGEVKKGDQKAFNFTVSFSYKKETLPSPLKSVKK